MPSFQGGFWEYFVFGEDKRNKLLGFRFSGKIRNTFIKLRIMPGVECAGRLYVSDVQHAAVRARHGCVEGAGDRGQGRSV